MRLAVLVLSVLVLAGCGAPAQAPDSKDGGPDFDGYGLDATDTTGVIRGVVFDEAIRPLAGAQVDIQGPGFQRNVTTRGEASDAGQPTDASMVGTFGLDGVPPGTYFLKASKAGYFTATTSVEVVAGVDEPEAVRLQLGADPANKPYSVPYAFDGYLQCSARVIITAYPCTAGAGQDVFVSEEPLERVPDWIQSEMVWQSTQAAGDALSLVSECFPGESEPDPCPAGSLRLNYSEGGSPRIIAINQTVAAHYNVGNGSVYRFRIFAFGREDTDLVDEDAHNERLNQTTNGVVPCIRWPPTPLTPNACFRFTGVGVIVNQQVKVYTNVFYGYTPPPGWKFIDNSEVPPPP